VQPSNRLLAALPAEDYARLVPDLRTVHVADGTRLQGCGHNRIYFPITGMCSIGNVMDDGRVIEIAVVGGEGLVGLAALTGDEMSPRKSYLQVTDGLSYSMPLNNFDRELSRGGALRRVVDDYSRAFLESLIQSAACNRLHTLQSRCCRWLLIVRDRTGRNQFELNQSFVATALGASLQDLAEVFRKLEDLDAIASAKGAVVIRDRHQLESLACACYELAQRTMQRLATAMGERAPQQPAAEETAREPAEVIHLRPVSQCPRCGIAMTTQHATERECIRAIDAEMRLLMRRTHQLHKQREFLARDWLNALRQFAQGRRAKTS